MEAWYELALGLMGLDMCLLEDKPSVSTDDSSFDSKAKLKNGKGPLACV